MREFVVMEKELKYDIDYENDDIDYQLLSYSKNFLRISFDFVI